MNVLGVGISPINLEDAVDMIGSWIESRTPHYEAVVEGINRARPEIVWVGLGTEQACLIHFAKHCLFFTEGDLGSHIYVPPFMGKDVTAVAPRSIYELESAPIDFWNRGVFRFGGQIVPLPTEEALRSDSSMRQTVQQILSHVPVALGGRAERVSDQ